MNIVLERQQILLFRRKACKRLSNKILLNQDKITDTEEYFLEDAEIGIISYGISGRASLKAVKVLRKGC